MAEGATDDAHARRLRRRPGPARARRRLQLARGRQRHAARPRLPRRAPRPRALDVLRRRADPRRLARALAGDPDLLLLDEPTNHLDIESLEWLENHLQNLDAAVVLVAHDRWFLEAVGTSVLELEGGRARFFKGTWHTWRKEKAAREVALGRALEKQEARSRGSSASSTASAPARARARPSRASSSSTRSTASSATRATAARSASRSSRPSAPAASCSSSRTAR